MKLFFSHTANRTTLSRKICFPNLGNKLPSLAQRSFHATLPIKNASTQKNRTLSLGSAPKNRLAPFLPRKINSAQQRNLNTTTANSLPQKTMNNTLPQKTTNNTFQFYHNAQNAQSNKFLKKFRAHQVLFDLIDFAQLSQMIRSDPQFLISLSQKRFPQLSADSSRTPFHTFYDQNGILSLIDHKIFLKKEKLFPPDYFLDEDRISKSSSAAVELIQHHPWVLRFPFLVGPDFALQINSRLSAQSVLDYTASYKK